MHWVKVYLIREHSLWEIPTPSNCSWTWRKLLSIRHRIRPHIQIKIGNGEDALLWYDNWQPIGPILSIFDDRIIHESGLPRLARVSDVIHDGVWAWPVVNSPNLVLLKDSIPATFQPDFGQKDKSVWTPSATGSFSTLSAWRTFRTPRPEVDWHKLIWFSGNIPKAAFLLWLAVRQRLGTQDRLHNPSPTGCLFCCSPLESHDHLFFECPVTRQVWLSILAKCYGQPPLSRWTDLINWMVRNWKGKSLATKVNKLAIAATIYTLWVERNSRFHTNSTSDVGFLIRSTTSLIRSRLLSYINIEDTSINRRI